MEELRSGRKGWCPWGAGNGSGVPSWMVVLSLGFDVSARGHKRPINFESDMC